MGAGREPGPNHVSRLAKRIARITAENLVSGLTTQTDLHGLRCQFADDRHREHRRANDRLVLVIHQPAELIREVRSIHGDEPEIETKGFRSSLLIRTLISDSLPREMNPETDGLLPGLGGK